MIPQILKIFKVKNIIFSGLTNENLITEIKNQDYTINQLTTKSNHIEELLNLKNYDAIFIEDDANWYTIFNELNIIKKNNDEFPLIFVCNNKFPNKRRDSYINPNEIPIKFRKKHTKDLPICYDNKKIIINDGLYHACEENTPQNGVLTAIEDFITENSHVGIMKINFITEITILYQKLPINEKRIQIILKNNNELISENNLPDKLIENQLLISYIDNFNIYNENLSEIEVEITKKNSIIDDYKNQLRTRNNEINYKNSQIKGIKSKLNLKDSQIRNIESKLINKKNEIDNLKNQLKTTNNKLDSTYHELENKKKDFNEKFSSMYNSRTHETEKIISNLKQTEEKFNNKIKLLNKEHNQKETNYNTQIQNLKKENQQKETNFNTQIQNLKKENQQKESTLRFKILKRKINKKRMNMSIKSQ